MVTAQWECRAQILGFDPQQAFSARSFSAESTRTTAHGLNHLFTVSNPHSPSYAITFRFVRSDSREVWLEETSEAEFDTAGRYIRLKGLTVDITERKRAEEHQAVLIAELDHRVKNALARVSVVAMFTREGSSSIDEFVKSLQRRIQSMADAHALLSQSRWHGVGLTDLVRSQLGPYTTNTTTKIAGPDVTPPRPQPKRLR